MGKSSQQRGLQGEYEFIRQLPSGGIKVSRPRKRGIDAVGIKRLRFMIRTWEVKRTKRGLVTLYAWMNQAKEEGADAVVFRMDRQEWLVVVPLNSALEAYEWEN